MLLLRLLSLPTNIHAVPCKCVESRMEATDNDIHMGLEPRLHSRWDWILHIIELSQDQLQMILVGLESDNAIMMKWQNTIYVM